MFDSYLRERARQTGQPFVPFDPVRDYDEYVDGKPRADGTRSFLESRGITLPDGHDDDPADAQTIHGLGNRKNEIVLQRIRAGAAGRAGKFGYVVGVDRVGQADALREHGANVVVTDLADLMDRP